MKKHEICILLMLAFLTLLASCASKTPAAAAEETEDNAAVPVGLILSIDPDSVTPEGLTLTVYRTEVSGDWIFGVDYTVERRTDAGWEPVPPADPDLNYCFTAEGYTLLPGETKTVTIDWQKLYGELLPGRYRIGKSTSRYPGGVSSPVTVWAEFEITEQAQSSSAD